MNRLRKLALAVGVLCAFSLFSANLFSQGCASCYTTAAAGGPQTAHALRSGILLLLFPPTLIFAGIIITLRKWKQSPQVLSSITDRQRAPRHSEPKDERTK